MAARSNTVLDQLAAFIARAQAGKLRNLWLEDDLMKVYVRKANRRLAGTTLTTCLDLATFEVFEPGRKTFSEWFLPGAIELNPWHATFIESVQEPRLRKFLLKVGFRREDGFPLDDDYCPNFFLPRTESLRY